MTVNLILPMMMRIADLEVNKCPKFLPRNIFGSYLSIYFPEVKL